MIAFSCSQCGKQFILKPEFAGRTTACSGCTAPLVVPEPGPTVAAPRIGFSCDKCGMKFSVPGACAGRKTTCPTCKEPLIVPSPDQTLSYQPVMGPIRGTHSGLVQAGVEGGVTLAGDFATAETLSMQNLIDGKANDGARYIVESELARGGMGAIMRAVDCDIRREVAVKYLLAQGDPKKKLRFVEEAQITGQLEHPNIVPIHELGVDAQKRIFFAMKMVKGRSLADVLKSLRSEPDSRERDGSPRVSGSDTAKEYSQGRLLNILINICHALAYAHARGVVHRDLKPANIMVGDFGEVYVMDWGLAKVLRAGVATTGTEPVMALPVAKPMNPFDFSEPPLAKPMTPGETSGSSGSGKVITSRELDADLTQEGSVLGTPVYMPPEQASGQINDIDERSDIYSLGAILYEMVTLHPPISRQGGYWAILMRVTEGQIEPPEQKAPERARAGAIPPELSAIAMKALAKSKDDRYPNVAALRQDIERFLEGRSVSAKQDTIQEMAIKLVKRNKGASIATAAAVVVLLIGGVWSLAAILTANAHTKKAYHDLVDEQEAKKELARKSVPSLVRAAKLLINERQFDDALVQLDGALNVDAQQAEARLLKGHVLLARQEFAAARAEIERYLKLKPSQTGVRELMRIAANASGDKIGDLFALADELNREKAFAPAAHLMQRAEKLLAPRKELLEVYRRRLEAAWPGSGSSLNLDDKGQLALNFGFSKWEISDLTPLAGMSIDFLDLREQKNVRDLTPLRGLPLKMLLLPGTSVSDLAPLSEVPLIELQLSNKVTSLEPLRKVPLQILNCSFAPITDLTPLKEISSLRRLVLYGCRVTDLTPLRGMPLTTLDISRCPVKDIAPLRGMPLVELNMMEGCRSADLSPLQGMALKVLTAGEGYAISDISVLRGMPLEGLTLTQCLVTDLAPLRGAQLKRLAIIACSVQDLQPLHGMPIEELTLNGDFRNIAPLKGMPLKAVTIYNAVELRDLTPLQGAPLESLELRTCPKVQDLTPLAEMKLQTLGLPPEPSKGIDAIRSMKSLGRINDLPPLQFWKQWDAAKAKSK